MKKKTKKKRLSRAEALAAMGATADPRYNPRVNVEPHGRTCEQHAPAEHELAIMKRLEERGLLAHVGAMVFDAGSTMHEVCSRSQTKNTTAARHAAWWYLSQEKDFSYREIAMLWSVDPSAVGGAMKRKYANTDHD